MNGLQRVTKKEKWNPVSELEIASRSHTVQQMHLGPFTQFHFHDGVHVLSVHERNFHDLHITSSFFHDPVESCHGSV